LDRSATAKKKRNKKLTYHILIDFTHNYMKIKQNVSGRNFML